MVVISSDLSYELRVRGAVSKFLESRVSRLGLELSDCLKEPTGSSKKTFAIPLAIEGEFIAWFRNQIPGRFETSPRNSSAGVKALETSQNSAPLKRKRAIRIDSDEEDGETLPEPDMSSINLLLEQLCDLPMETTDLLEEGSSSKSTAAEDLPEIFTPERPPSPLWSFPWLNDSHSDHGNVAAAPSNEQTTGAENGIDPSMFEMSSPERGTMKFAAYSILRGSESQVVAAQEQDDDIVLTPDSTPQRAPHNDIGVDPVHLSAKLAKVLFPDNESEKDESENVSTEPASNESLSALEALDDTRSPIQDEQSTVTSEELSSTTIPMTIEDVDAAMNVQETMVMTVQEKLPLAETILITEETTDVSQVNDTLAVMEESSRSVSPILVDEGDVEPQTALPLPSEEALIEKETMSDTPKEDSTIGGLQEGDTVQMPGQEAADSEMSIISVFEKDLSIAPKTSPTCDKEADTLQDFVPDSTENQASLAFPAQDSMSTHDGLTSNIREWAPVSLSDTVEGQTNATPHNAASELVLIDENSDSPASHKTTDIHTHATAETKTEDAAEETDKKGQTLTRYNT